MEASKKTLEKEVFEGGLAKKKEFVHSLFFKKNKEKKPSGQPRHTYLSLHFFLLLLLPISWLSAYTRYSTPLRTYS